MARFISRLKPSGDGSFGAGVVMAATEQKQRSKGDGGDDPAGGQGSKKVSKKGEELKEEMDDLLDEIDAVLEENAEEFVKNYVQRGGE
jgi:ubiquitin-like protein Pup